MATETQVKQLIGCKIIGINGEEIGKVGQVYLNDASRQPEWVTVRTGLFGMRESFVPLRNARHVGEELHVPYDKNLVKDAPHLDVGQHLSVEEESQLYRHYGLGQPRMPGPPQTSRRRGDVLDAVRGEAPALPGTADARHSLTGLGRARGTGQSLPDLEVYEPTPAYESTAPDPAPRYEPALGYDPALHDTRPGGDASGDLMITRFEERLRITKECREAGRVRVRRYVETEEAEGTIQLIREEIVVEREAITDDGVDEVREIGEDEQEIILREERPVVTAESYPVERIRVRIKQIPVEETVRGEVRKERVEVDEGDVTYASSAGERETPMI